MDYPEIHDDRIYTTGEQEIDLGQVQQVLYWAKKWEISPRQLTNACEAVQSRNVKKVEAYLREKGFAL